MSPESDSSGIWLSLEVLAIFDMTSDNFVEDAGLLDLRNVVFLGVKTLLEEIFQTPIFLE